MGHITRHSFFPFFHIRHVFTETCLPSFEVIIGVISDRMTGCQHLSKHFRMLVNILSYHEECGLNAVLIQDG